MSEENLEVKKDDVITVPIQMEKCEIVIRKSKKLTHLEKLVLKLINKDNSLINLVEAFNVGKHIMNYILTPLIYSGIIHIDLNSGLVTLSEKIIEYVEKDKLNEFLDVETTVNKYPVIILQEKIGGELFIKNDVNDYLKTPNPDKTNFIDLKSSPPETFQQLYNYSLLKYTQCVKSRVRDLENVEKINFLYPLYQDKLYIPIKVEEGVVFNLDFEIFPRVVQKYWQKAYESKLMESEKTIEDLTLETPIILSNKKFITQTLINLNFLQEEINAFNNLEENLSLQILLEDNFDKLKKDCKILKERIESVNKIIFKYKNLEVKQLIIEHIKSAQDFIIFCSDKLNLDNISFLQSIIYESSQNEVPIIFIWGGVEEISRNEQHEKIKEFRLSVSSGLERKNKDRIFFTISSNMIDANFLIIDNNKAFYNNLSFLGYNYNEASLIIPNIYLEGGKTPLSLLQFVIDYLPEFFDRKKVLNKYLAKSTQVYRNKLSDDRINIINFLEKKIEDLEFFILNESIESTNRILDELKEKINTLMNIECISLFYDYEHEDILIDTMREIKAPFQLITEKLSQKRIGPIFQSHLDEIPSFSILLNKTDIIKSSIQWEEGIRKLDKITKECENCNFLELSKNLNFNAILAGNEVIVISNYPYLAPIGRRAFNLRAKRIGIICNSLSIVDTILEFIASIK
jgi:hypothetical protein